MHEDFLRHIWSRQMFDASRLVTTDGIPVKILSPGILSRQSGPDFRNAKVDFGGIVYSGEIEFHRTSEDWSVHNHQHDQHYNSVILHVVLQGEPIPARTESGRIIPTIVLEPYLSASIETINDHLSREEYNSRHRRIRCATVNDPILPDQLNEWIQVLFRERVHEKIDRMHQRLDDIVLSMQRTVGEPDAEYHPILDTFPGSTGIVDAAQYSLRAAWEQLLFEEIMDCLGYSNNRIPMKHLAEHMSLQKLRNILTPLQKNDPSSSQVSISHIEAVLFKASGLLPDMKELTDTDAKVYVHSLTSALDELQYKVPDLPIHPTEWNFSPTRPANFPTIRIAAASVMAMNILKYSLFRSMIVLIGGRYSSLRSKIAHLTSLLDAGDHPFWNYHYSFSEATFQKHSVLGTARMNDIIVNTIIPFTCLYARIFRDELLADLCLKLSTELPLLEENAVLRTMRAQLVKEKIQLSAAYQQQGLLQLYKRYCTADRCSECRIGIEVMNL